LGTLLIDYLATQQDVAFSEATFTLVYDQFEAYFYADGIRYRYLAPLDHFELEDERLELAPDLAIVQMPDRDRQEILLQFRLLSPLHVPRVVPVLARAALEMFLESPKLFAIAPDWLDEQLPRQRVERTFDQVYRALRLFKGGNFSYGGILILPTSW